MNVDRSVQTVATETITTLKWNDDVYDWVRIVPLDEGNFSVDFHRFPF